MRERERGGMVFKFQICAKIAYFQAGDEKK